MIRHCLIAVSLFALCSSNSIFAQSVSLTESTKGSYFRIAMHMELSGEMKLRREGKIIALKETGSARHVFVERILRSDKHGATKSARFYHDAHAQFTIEKDRIERRLAAAHRLIVAQRHEDQTFTYSPKETLTREELELTEHLDTLALGGLLAGKEVYIGDTWKIRPAVIQAMCGLDGVTEQNVSGKLVKSTAATAHVHVGGTINGIDMGAAVKLQVEADLEFDRKKQVITSVKWRQKDEREQGPISPALNVDVAITVKRAPISPVKELSDFALVPVPSQAFPPKRMTRLVYTDAKNRFIWKYDRAWHLVARTEKHIVLRLMDRGDFIAQATLSPWQKAAPGKHISVEDFRNAMEQIPAWQSQQVLDKGTNITSDQKYWVYRIGAAGKMEGVEAVQYFYLIAGPQGNQFVVTFTMSPNQAKKLEARDLSLIQNLTITNN